MIVRQIVKNSATLHYLLAQSFSKSFFNKGQSITEPINKPEDRETRDKKREDLAALVEKINDANKSFLGVKLNTNYLKVNKVVKYADVAGLTTDTKSVNDIPIEISSKQADNAVFEMVDQQAALGQKSGQVVFSWARVEPAIKQIKKIVKDYMVTLSKKGRFSNLEPNFELQCIKIMNSLDPKLQIKLENTEAEPQIKIKSITVLKGLSVYRNDNYSTDFYEKSEEEGVDGILNYKLNKQMNEEYPEVQWFSTKRINARFEILVRGGPVLNILQSGNSVGTTANVIHSVVIESDLIPPPPLAEYQLTPEQYLRSYRLIPKSLLLTNFDRKNNFYGLTYTQVQKKTILVNRIV